MSTLTDPTLQERLDYYRRQVSLERADALLARGRRERAAAWALGWNGEGDPGAFVREAQRPTVLHPLAPRCAPGYSLELLPLQIDLCACGCGRSLPAGSHPDRKYFDDACRRRYARSLNGHGDDAAELPEDTTAPTEGATP